MDKTSHLHLHQLRSSALKPLTGIPSALLLIILMYTLWSQKAPTERDEDNASLINLAPPCNHPDSLALMALFNATNGTMWSNRTNWGDTCDVCLWFGVNCDANNRVSELNLAFNNLVGDIPGELGDLNHLEMLDLSSNSLSSFSNSVTFLPLKSFNISNNDFSGNLDPAIANLAPTLEEFYITNNQFSGAIPSEVGRLTNLRVLTMENNNFNSIPAQIGNLINLEIWYCGGMSISSVPGTIGDLSSLRELYFSFNEIRSIPVELGNLASIEEIYIEYNLLAGEIPSSLGNLNTLRVLSLEGNYLSGHIPLEMANLTALQYLFLGSNNLSGPLHYSLGELPNLQRLEVFDNNLEGCIPTSFTSLCNLPFSFYYSDNPCLWQGTLNEFCNGTPCTFEDYSLFADHATVCAGSPLDLRTSGGATFIWSTGESTSDITVSPLVDTWYYLTLTTVGGCTRMDSILIQINERPSASVIGTDVTIPGGSDGTATANVVAGESPYDFGWSNGATSQSIADLGAGKYFMTATDANGCIDTASVVIKEPLCLSAGTACDDHDPTTYHDEEDGICGCSGIPCPSISPNLNINHVSCFGAKDGWVVLDPYGGVAPYSFNWSTGSNSNEITALGPGTYYITITDSYGCQITTSTNIIEPGALILTWVKEDESLEGASDGSIDLTSTGGSMPHTYLWSNGARSEDISGLSGNGSIYGVTVTDRNGCTAMAQIDINTGCPLIGAPCDDGLSTTYDDSEDGSCQCIGVPCPVITVNLDGTDPSCEKSTDGSARIAPSGGKAPYSIQWSTGDTMEEVEDLGSGIYHVTIIDENGCSSESSITLEEPSALTLGLAGRDESTPGVADGAILTRVSGGTFPYFYRWSTGAETKDLSALTGDNMRYYVSVTDARGCLVSDSIVLGTGCLAAGLPCDDGNSQTFQDEQDGQCGCQGIPCPDFKLNERITPVHCGNLNSGSILLNPEGGVAPYTFAWSNGQTGPANQNLSSRIYVVTVTDVNGCQTTGFLQVPMSSQMRLKIETVNESQLDAKNGSIDLTVSGGSLPYSYTWSNGANTEDIDNLTGDSLYKVIVTDGAGCQDSIETVLKTGCAKVGSICDDGDVNTYGDSIDAFCNCVGIICQPNSELVVKVQDVSCFGQADGWITLDTTGLMLSEIQWENGNRGVSVSNLGAGTHRVSLLKQTGCQEIHTIEVQSPDILELDLVGIDASAFALGSAQVDIIGGTEPYHIMWSTGSTFPTATELIPGHYYHVSVKDARDCEVYDSIFIAEFVCASLSEELFQVSINSGSTCNPKSVIQIEPGSGAPDSLLFSLDQGLTFQKNPFFSDLVPGNYHPYILDQVLGCSLILDQVTISERAIPGVQAIDPSACSSSDGQILNATQEFRIGLQTNGPWFEDAISGLPAGFYTVYAQSNDSSCTTFTDTIQLGMPISGNELIIKTKDANCGQEFGSIEVFPLLDELSFNLNGTDLWYQSTQMFEVSPGPYQLRVRLADGCVRHYSSFEIKSSSHLGQNSIVALSPSHCDNSDGIIHATVPGGQEIDYSLDAGLNWQSNGFFDGLSVGNYSLYFRSEGNCLDSVEVVLSTISTSGQIDTVRILHPSCANSQDGYIHLEVSLDTGQYEWQWSNGAQGNQVGRLGHGYYEVEIKKGPFCSILHQIALNEPDSISLDLPFLDGVIYCQGQTISIALHDTALIYEWSRNDLPFSSGNVIEIAQGGQYKITARNKRGCEESKKFEVEYGDDIFHADFLVAAMAVLNEPTYAVEISWPVPDSISWEIESGVLSETILNRAVFEFDQVGDQVIRLKAMKNGCTSIIEKRITVVENIDQLDFTPSISGQSLNVSLFPNPNLGAFNVVVESIERTDIQIRIYDEEGSLFYSDQETDVETYARHIDLSSSPAGVYTLLVQTKRNWKTLSFVLK